MKHKYKTCSECGKKRLYPQNKIKSDCCNALFVMNRDLSDKQIEKRRQQLLDQMLMELTKRKIIKDGLIGFDSYCGIIKNDKPSTAILNEDQANELELQPVFPHSEFYWNYEKKCLYIKYKDKYLSITAEV